MIFDDIDIKILKENFDEDLLKQIDSNNVNRIFKYLKENDIYYYKDQVPTYLATVGEGGTAYPLAIKDGNLYVGGNHFMSKYLIDTGYMIETEEAYVKYDTDGSEAYYYRTCNSQFEDYDEETAKQRFEELFTEQESAEVINF